MVTGTPLIVTLYVYCLPCCYLLAMSYVRQFHDVDVPVDDTVSPFFVLEGQRFISC